MKREPCLDCGRPYHARGLCVGCYKRAWIAGALPNYLPGREKTGPMTAEDYEFLRDDGATLNGAAMRLGMTRAALYQCLHRQGFRYNAQREGYYR